MTRIAYPETRRVDIVEEHFGQDVADPYRWLENDARSDAEVAAWVAAQNQVARAHLDQLPGREVFRTRLTALYDHERITAPRKRGGRYFHARNSGLQSQAVLLVRDGASAEARVLIDPNTWSDDGTTALAEWSVSKDGTHVAYAVQDGGTDWRTIRVLNVDTGAVLEDAVKWARVTGISWLEDGAGFFYSRYPESAQGTASQAGVTDHAVHFHTLGTAQSQDRLVHATPDQPNLLHLIDVMPGGRYAAISSLRGSGSNALAIVDLTDPAWEPRRLIDNFDDEWTPIGHVGTTLFLLTSKGAERKRIVTLDLAQADPAVTDLISEQAEVLNGANLLGGRLLASYLVDVKTEIRRFKLDGTADGTVALPGIGTAGGFTGEPDDPESFFVFTSFNAPTTIHRYDIATDTRTVWAEPRVSIDLDRIIVEQRFFPSKDGTRTPLFIVRRKVDAERSTQ